MQTHLEDLFFNTDPLGYIGPLALIILSYLLFKRDRALGLFGFIVNMLFVAHYYTLVSVTPAYWWHIYLLILGSLFTVVFPLWNR